MTISAVIAWLVIGFAIGALAHLLGPGRQRTGVLRTLGSGMAGALLGGFTTAVIVGPGHIINTFVIALIVSALLIRAATRPAYRRPDRHYAHNQMKER